jgi:hypothetical protein
MSSIQRLLLSLKEWIQEISLEIKKQKRLLLENMVFLPYEPPGTLH